MANYKRPHRCLGCGDSVEGNFTYCINCRRDRRREQMRQAQAKVRQNMRDPDDKLALRLKRKHITTLTDLQAMPATAFGRAVTQIMNKERNYSPPAGRGDDTKRIR